VTPRHRARRATAAALPAAPRLPGRARVERLPNGLTVCLLEHRQAPLVTAALWYRAGTRDEPETHLGAAHFLEHMMFKGSRRYGPGEIDRRTQAKGGTNNAFTSHDATAYYFSFASDRWREALDIEADRMRGLLLDPREVENERQVIQEEIGMYEDDPWDALEIHALREFFGGHPYGRPVLGTRATVAATGAADLARFHRDFYRPANAVLVVGGDVGPEALDAVALAFGDLEGAAADRPALRAPAPPEGLRRLERRQGEVPRMLLTLPAPAATHPDHAALRLVVALLAGGRASRLHSALVDEGQLALAVSADLAESQLPGGLVFGMELLPGVEAARAEAALLAELAAVRGAAAAPAEIERAKQVVIADWTFGHERVHQQALTAGFELTLFELGHHERELEALLGASPDEVAAVAGRYLDPERSGLLAWSLPADERVGPPV
jgi:zinc protease